MIPIVDMTRMLAQRGAMVTIFTTPLNADRFTSVLYRAAVQSGHRIRVILVKKLNEVSKLFCSSGII